MYTVNNFNETLINIIQLIYVSSPTEYYSVESSIVMYNLESI
jgi:hypothetical protein